MHAHVLVGLYESHLFKAFPNWEVKFVGFFEKTLDFCEGPFKVAAYEIITKLYSFLPLNYL